MSVTYVLTIRKPTLESPGVDIKQSTSFEVLSYSFRYIVIDSCRAKTMGITSNYNTIIPLAIVQVKKNKVN